MQNFPLPPPAPDADAGLHAEAAAGIAAHMLPPPAYPTDPHGDESRRLTYLGSVAYAVGSFPLAHHHFCQALHHLLHPNRRQIFAPERQLGMRGDICINKTYLKELVHSCPLLDPERYAPDKMRAHQTAIDWGRQRVRMGYPRYGAISAEAGDAYNDGGGAGGDADFHLTSPPKAPYPWNEIYTNMETKRRQHQERRASSLSLSSSSPSDLNHKDDIAHTCNDVDSDIEMEDAEGQVDDDHYADQEEDKEDDAFNHILAAAGLNIPTLSLEHHHRLDQIGEFDELVDPILEDAPHFIDAQGDVSSLDPTTFQTSTVTLPSCRPRRVDDADVLILGMILFDLGLCHFSICQYGQALELIQMAHSYLQPKESDRCFEDLVLMLEDDMAVIRDFIRLRSKQRDHDFQEKKIRELLVQLLALSSSTSSTPTSCE